MIVLATKRKVDKAVIVTVLPITHAAPADLTSAVEIPRAIKRHLGLDDARSWIVIAEGNEFVWAGHDLKKVSNSDSYEFGMLPPRFFDQVRDAFVAFNKAGQSISTLRS